MNGMRGGKGGGCMLVVVDSIYNRSGEEKRKRASYDVRGEEMNEGYQPDSITKEST